MSQGQMIFTGFAAVVIFWQFAKGWRLGLVRQIVRFAALGLAYFAAIWGASSVAPFLQPLGYPHIVLLGLAGALIWVLAYVVITGFGAVLFKRTSQQDLGIVWFFYGITGALLGAAFGILLVLVAADVVRILGATAESATPDPKKRSFFISEVVEVKHAIEKSNFGDILKTIDPVPKQAYTIADKVGRVVADPESMARLLTYPGSRELAQRPDLQALHSDPDVLAALRDKRYNDLLKNPKVVKALNAPQTAALFREFQWEKALDYALDTHSNPPK